MQLDNLAKVVRNRRLRWHGQVERSDGWLKKTQKLKPTGCHCHGRPKKAWPEVIDIDLLALGLRPTNPTGEKTCISGNKQKKTNMAAMRPC